MKILSIEQGNPYYCVDGKEYESINKVDKHTIYDLMRIIYNSDSIDISDFCNTDVATINNPAEKIVYENIVRSLEDFLSKKENLKKEINELFKDVDSLT